MKTKSLLYNSYNNTNGIGAKLDESFDLRPSSTGKYKHNESSRMYCDILGRKYCQMCFEGNLRETSFVKSLTDAENYISRVASPARVESTIPSLTTSLHANDSSRSLIGEDRVEHIVNYVFPIMYSSLSSASSKVERTWTRADSVSTVSSRNMSRQRALSEDLSTISIKSLASTDNFGDDERSLSSEVNTKSACNRGEFSTFDKQELPIIRRKVNGEFKSHNMQRITNDDITNEEEVDDFDEDKILDLRREIASKSYQFLVRRSSVVAKNVRKRTNEKIKDQVAKWTPSFSEEYPRVRNSFRRTGSFARQKRENTIQNIQAKAKTQSLNNQLSSSYLEKLKQPKVSESILPMEPVMCGIKYMKNRWREEALYRNNEFAIKLGLLGK